MNNATLTAFRNIAESMHKPEQTMTARDMALSSHDLSRDGYRAMDANGQVWIWNDGRCLWVAATTLRPPTYIVTRTFTGELLDGISYTEKTTVRYEVGQVCERPLFNGSPWRIDAVKVAD